MLNYDNGLGTEDFSSRGEVVDYCEFMCGAGACNDLTSDDLRNDDHCHRNSSHEYMSNDKLSKMGGQACPIVVHVTRRQRTRTVKVRKALSDPCPAEQTDNGHHFSLNSVSEVRS